MKSSLQSWIIFASICFNGAVAVGEPGKLIIECSEPIWVGVEVSPDDVLAPKKSAWFSCMDSMLNCQVPADGSGVIVEATDKVERVSISLMPPTRNMYAVLQDCRTLRTDSVAVFQKYEGSRQRSGVGEALDGSVSALWREMDSLVESWHNKYAPPSGTYSGSQLMTVGVGDFFSIPYDVPFLADLYYSSISKEYWQPRMELNMELLRKKVKVARDPGYDGGGLRKIDDGYRQHWEQVILMVNGSNLPLPEDVRQLDLRLADLRKRWRDERSRLISLWEEIPSKVIKISITSPKFGLECNVEKGKTAIVDLTQENATVAVIPYFPIVGKEVDASTAPTDRVRQRMRVPSD